MPAALRVDHLVLLVRDLARAREDFSALGFTVVPGGEHEKLGTHNALIALCDQSYLELIAFRAGQGEGAAGGGPAERYGRWRAAGEGLVDFALVPSEIEEAIEEARRRGLDLLGPWPGGRRRPDGVEVAWRFAFPDRPDLPFLCADVTPRSLRVPGGEALLHRNGAQGLRRITVQVEDLERSAERYGRLLGRGPLPPAGSPLPESRAVHFPLGPTTLTLVSPSGPRSPLRASLTHGARLELVHEPAAAGA